MATVNMRIDEETHGIIRALAGDRPMHEVVHEAVEDLQRKRFFEQMNAAYAALQESPEAWDQELKERAEWDATLGDGIARDG